ncbi:MAG: aspartate carbamoyltransferase [Candidatus Nezhaarchaeales archaeon]
MAISGSSYIGRDVISILDFNRYDLELLFNAADDLMKADARSNILRGMVMATLFFEPSTRTKLSFEAAMLRLGGSVIGFTDPSTTSMAKGEAFEDTIRVVDGYADVIVIRHRVEGTAKLAADIAKAPVINAGDGINEHPTQAMIDLYTIRRELGGIDGLKVAVVADLAHSRAAVSFVLGLSRFKDVSLTLVSPKELKLRSEVKQRLKDEGMKIVEVEQIDKDVISGVDVIYVTRVQKERFKSFEDYERVKGSYMVNAEVLSGAKSSMIILHPLPRLDELPREVDLLPYAKYFQQARNGLFVRMALLSLILKGKIKESSL